MGHNMKISLITFISLLVGLSLGFFYGSTSGKETGRTALLAEQTAAAEVALKEAQDEIIEKANPFAETEVNPFEGSYQNPFEGGVTNPFAQ